MIKTILNTIPRKYIQRVAGFLVPLSSIFLYGNRYRCPICGGSFRRMLSYGYVESRKNALCPRCLSLERHRMLWYYLNNCTSLFYEKHSVLHIAPEYPFLKRFERLLEKSGGEYITADLESPLAKVKMNVEDIPFEDNRFDVVICNHVLEHVDNDRKALSEIFRVLKSGGFAILLSPIDSSRDRTYEDSSIVTPEERKVHFGQSDHLRVYGLDYSKRLESEGFIVDEVQISSLLDSDACRKMGFSSEIIYVANKK